MYTENTKSGQLQEKKKILKQKKTKEKKNGLQHSVILVF